MKDFEVLQQMDAALWEEDDDLTQEPMNGRKAVYFEQENGKGRKNTGLKFLIFLELLGILAVVWWWIKWLY